MALTKSKAGRLGGLATFNRYGREFYVVAGRRGGRPRSLTLGELKKQSQSLQGKNNTQGGKDTPGVLASESLAKMKRLWADRQRSTAGKEIIEAGVII